MKYNLQQTIRWLICCCCILLSGVIGSPITLIDLTYEFSNNMSIFPLHKKFESINYAEIPIKSEDGSNIRVAVREVSGSEHAGTHMDAPLHFIVNGKTIEQIPIEQFTGPAVVIDIANKAEKNADSEVTMSDILEWETKYGRIPDGSIVLMYSGWGKYWTNDVKYLGNDRKDLNELHYPGFHQDVCKWLVKERNIHGVGGDTVATDPGYRHMFPCHTILFERDVFILENVANVDKLPPIGAIVRAYPMKIRGGTGAPTRIIASLNENPRKIAMSSFIVKAISYFF